MKTFVERGDKRGVVQLFLEEARGKKGEELGTIRFSASKERSSNHA